MKKPLNLFVRFGVLSLYLLSVGISACKKQETHPSVPAFVAEDGELKNKDASSPPKVGQKVPDFILEDRTGKKYQLSSFRGNLVFLNFWATWCPPCVEELPAMEVLNQRFKAKKFMMIAVSADESWERVDTFMSELNRPPSFLVLLDPEKQLTTGVFGTTKFPETYVISPEGILLKKYEGSYNWNDPARLKEFEALLSKKDK
ncbi:MAG: TlpA family protein disulfide reductase [Deltaproteobacteria bacterium]|nr:TlpA family protein disulfide reductase [Deltaproteobacteria bacterium]